jgi:hypothetical protein
MRLVLVGVAPVSGLIGISSKLQVRNEDGYLQIVSFFRMMAVPE